jgi:cell division protein FtsI (penicillin-binding protein 3)
MTHSSYVTRGAMVCFVFVICYLIIICALFFIQIKNHEFYSNLGNQQYFINVTTYPERAAIIDRNNVPLALNHEQISAFIMPQRIKKKDELVTFLKAAFPDAYARYQTQTHKPFMFVKRNLSDDEIQTIKSSHIKEIHLMKEPHRWYPVACASTIVGSTDIDNHGAFGIEYIYDKQLAGTPSTYQLEKDARSGYFYVTKETQTAGTEGTPVHLTIDSTLQFLAAQEVEKTRAQFNAQAGGALIMDPTNGDILAMVSCPYYDPNNIQDIQHTNNICISDAYELGSVMKVCVSLAALEEGLVTPDELIDCHNTKRMLLYGRPITTHLAMGVVPFKEVIQRSNNIGIAQVAYRLKEKLYDHHRKLALGKKTNVNLPGEQSGFVGDPAHWSKQSLISLSFGYELRATLLQLAKIFCMISNNGIMMQPRIDATAPIAYESETPLYKQETLDIVRSMLTEVVTQGSGTAAQRTGYTIMGKTGSAYLANEMGYSKTESIYTFAGIVEKDDYKRVIITFIKNPASTSYFASQVSAPLFGKIAERMLIHDTIIA